MAASAHTIALTSIDPCSEASGCESDRSDIGGHTELTYSFGIRWSELYRGPAKVRRAGGFIGAALALRGIGAEFPLPRAHGDIAYPKVMAPIENEHGGRNRSAKMPRLR